jgi:diguanylate cyclase (GGDEF)-like protein/PAS domain S-box-containing protein
MSQDLTKLTSEKNSSDSIKTMVSLAEEFLQNIDEPINYEKIAEDFRKITGAKFVIFNLYDPSGKTFTTKSIAGSLTLVRKASKIMGFKFLNNVWEEDLNRKELTKDNNITRFPSMTAIAGSQLNTELIPMIESLLGLGESIFVKITKKELMLGDFTLVMAKDKIFDKDDIAELYASQLGLFLTQKRSSLELKDNQRQLSDIIDSSPDATFVVDRNKKVLIWNRAMETMTHISSDEMIGKGEEAYMLPFYRDVQPHLFDVIFQTKKLKDLSYVKVSLENNIYSAVNFCKAMDEGRGRWISMTTSALHDSSGNIIGAIETIRDITEVKKIEEELIENELRIRTITSSAQDAIIMMGPKGEITFWNAASERIFGYTEKEALGKKLHEWIATPSNTHRYGASAQEFKDSGSGPLVGKTFDMTTHRKDKTEIQIQLSLSSVLIKDEWNAIGIVRDITESRRMEKALKESELGLVAAQEIAHIGNWELDLKTKTLTASREAYKIYGIPYESKASPMKTLRQVILKEHHHRLDEALAALINDNTPYEIEFELINKETKEHRFVHSRAVRICDESGTPIKVAGTLQDITDKTNTDRSLKESEEKYRSLYSAMDQGLAFYEVVFNRLGQPVDYIIIDINDSYTRLFGFKKEDVVGKSLKKLFPNIESYWLDEYKKVVLTGQSSYFENYYAAKDRIYSTYTYRIKTNQFAALITDITDRKKNEEHILRLSYYDHLTGLYNRRFFEEELKRLDVERNLPLTIVMGDVNGLKIINDSFGHDFGDSLLIKIVGAIKRGCRQDEIIARLGGDEFVILLPKTDSETAEKIVKRIHKYISEEKIGNLELSISFGYSTKHMITELASDIFKNAENQMYRHKLSDRSSARNRTISLIMNTLFEKNKREAIHSQRVSEICRDIATAMGYTKESIEQIASTGLIHDIGKVGIHESILNSNKRLTEDEWRQVKEHPEIGYRILSSSLEFAEIAEDVLEHHERWDGKGYPRGLSGKNISLNARIICLADAYDAMVSERPYKLMLSKQEAIEEIRYYSGKQFDPEIAEVFIEKVLKKQL